MDSFDRSAEDQLNLVNTLLLATRDRDDVVALLGNHELSYLKEGMRCSGYEYTKQLLVNHIKADMLRQFKTHLWLDDTTLVTHAGATSQLFPELEDVKTSLSEGSPRLYYIGRARGGMAPAGGIFWCDYWSEFQPVEGLTQIVGHSAYRPQGELPGIVMHSDCFNVDCLDRAPELLTVDTDDPESTVFEYITLGE